jgi:hypothetical protein
VNQRYKLSHTTAALAGLALVAGFLTMSSAVGPCGARAQSGTASVYLPIAVRGAFPPAPTPFTPSATPGVTETTVPTPTELVTPSATPTPLASRPPLVQVATYGGLAPDDQFGVERVLQAPWYTLYDNGVVVTFARPDGSRDASAPQVGQLEEADVAAAVSQLADGCHFFDLETPDESGICQPGLDTTYVRLDGADGFRSVHVYGLDWYLGADPPCRPRSGTPAPPSADMVCLAHVVTQLPFELPDTAAYWPDSGTLVVTRDRQSEGQPDWPLGQDLGAISPRFLQAGEVGLSAADVPVAVRAVADHRSAGWSMARFSQAGETYVVGVRIEPPRWNAYTDAPAPTATATASVTPDWCPPARPVCTPGPPPTPCSGRICPTPDPCPCLP